MSFLRRWLAARSAGPISGQQPFRPVVQSLEDRTTPTFNLAAQQTFGTGTTPTSVAVADVNGDGRVDVIVANKDSDTVSVLLNTTAAGATAPTFAAQQAFATGFSPVAASVGDFNGDGRADIAVANYGSSTVSVLLNTTIAGGATATFAARQTFATGTVPASIEVADFNGDGRADLAVANSGSNTVSILLNTAAVGANAPTFATQQTFATGFGPASVSAGDFNGDGRFDLVVANLGAGTNTASVLMNTTAVGATAATFANQQTLATGASPSSVSVGDVNGDGRVDIAVANSNATLNSVSVFLSTTAAGAAAATFAARQAFATGGTPASVKLADMNGDGRSDLLATTGSLSVLLNTTVAGASGATFATQQSFAAGSAPREVAVADFNGDGRADLVVAQSGSNTVSVLANASDGLAITRPGLAGQFSATGVWGYNRAINAWSQLTASNADALAVDPNGNMVANFGANGVWYYRSSTSAWTFINSNPAASVAIDPWGNAYASFHGYGTAVYRLATGGWATLVGTGATANKLAVSANGDVIANFSGYGVYRFRWTTGWNLLNGVDATALAVGPNGDMAVSFAGYGTYRLKGNSSWQQINGVAASSLAVGADGAVAAVFPGHGVAKYIPYASGWQVLTNNSAGISVAMDLFGNVFASFTGGGVWEFAAASGWHQRRAGDASLLGLGR